MKRIISLDGGGIRGVFSLQILARIEQLLREEHGRDDLVLADCCDFFAGTSTGAIIATSLAWGLPVADIEALYVERGREMFARAPWYTRWKSKYRADAIATFFRDFFRDDSAPDGITTLGSKKLRTLVLLVMRNASTGSPWPLCNNPNALYNDAALPDCNLNIPLWQLLRASTAAPSFFPPEQINLAGTPHLFVDGGITPFNNPTLLATMMATLPSYRINWSTGREKLHVVSIGTSNTRARLPRKLATRIHLFDQLKFVIPALLGSVAIEQDMLCRVLGDCVHGSPIDSEVGALNAPTVLPADQQLFTYARYDQTIDPDNGDASVTPALDDLRLIPALQQAGRAYAAEHVKREHLFPRHGV